MNILIVRSSANKVNKNGYNLQEIGLGKAFVDKGINCDIIYSNLKEKSYKEEIYVSDNGCKLNIFWTRLIFKLLNNGFYKELFNKRFFEKYDYVILSDYIQFMNYRISCIVPEKCILYQGPYKDMRKFVQHIYDIAFLKNFKNNVEISLTKSNLAKDYLEDKGFKNVHTIGVGLDIENIENTFKDNNYEDSYLKKINKKIDGRKVLLYIGVLEERRNIKFLFDIVKNILESNSDIVLLMVGKGKKKNSTEYFDYMKSIGIEENVIYIEKVSQDQIKKLYSLSNVFILPTKYEIFGMVILESMYFGVPVVTSLNGGSSMLIENEKNGYILENFIVEEWSNRILFLLNNENIGKKIGERSHIDICEKFRWRNIVENILKNIT